MKKIIALAAIALFMISCSEDDSQTTNPADTVLLKKMTSTDEDGHVITYNYAYDGNKLLSVIGTDGSSNTYDYTDNHITHLKQVTTNEISETFYEYFDNGRLKSQITNSVYPQYTINNSWSYTYNNDSSTIVHYIQDFTEQVNQHSEYNYTITYSGNKITYDYGDGTKNILIYDGKNGYLKNVLGFEEIYQTQNLLTHIYQLPPDQYILQDNTYVYNDLNFPISAIINEGNLDNSIKTYRYKYFYE